MSRARIRIKIFRRQINDPWLPGDKDVSTTMIYTRVLRLADSASATAVGAAGVHALYEARK
jgi:hypothetical protein